MIDGSDFFSSFGGGRYGNNGGGASGGGGSDKELYERLDLDATASLPEIKKSYRKKAMIMHPDKGGDAEDFKKLVEAYEILSDEDKKALYDRYGKDAVLGNNANNVGAQSRSAADAAKEFFGAFGGMGGGNPFGGGSFGTFNMPLILQIDLSLEDLFIGKEMSVQLDLPGTNKERHIVKLKVQAGMMGGQELAVRGYQIDRELIFRLREKRHSIFRRKNADLLVDIEISLKEALFGFERNIVHLDGKEIIVHSTSGEIINSNDVFTLEDQGMPIYGQPELRGRLFVRCIIVMPKKMWVDNKENQQSLHDLLSMDPIDKKVQSRMKNIQKAKVKARARAREKEKLKEYIGKSDSSIKNFPNASHTTSTMSDGNGNESQNGGLSLPMKRGDIRQFGTTGQTLYEEEYDGNPFQSFFFR